MKSLGLVSLGVLLGCVLAGACSSTDEGESACAQEPIDHFKELLIVEEEVVSDPRALNATSGPWSFRHAVEGAAPEGTDPGTFVHEWLRTWVDVRELNGFPIDRPHEDRADSMNTRILCPWLRRTAVNECNVDCSTCGSKKLDLAVAPFRLIGIANRLDVRESIPSVTNGEGRLLYALTDGAADDPASTVLPMTMVFEYVLPASRSVKEWADAWHGLGKFETFGEPYRAALEEITNEFTKRGAVPGAVNKSALRQVRTNESILNWIWQLREFVLTPEGTLRLAPVWNTPAVSLNGTETLAAFVRSNTDAIRRNVYELPVSMRGASSDALTYSWVLPGIDEETYNRFSTGTCNGCHSTSSMLDTAFHVSPFRPGRSKVSSFLSNPAGNDDGSPDILTQRAGALRRARCGGPAPAVAPN